MGKILDDIIKKRNGHYCHVLEVFNVDELESIVNSLVNEFQSEYNDKDIIDFFSTIAVYTSDDEELDYETREQEVNSFSFEKYLKEEYNIVEVNND